MDEDFEELNAFIPGNIRPIDMDNNRDRHRLKAVQQVVTNVPRMTDAAKEAKIRFLESRCDKLEKQVERLIQKVRTLEFNQNPN